MRIEFVQPPETARPVAGFEGMYAISSQGDVWSLPRTIVSKAGWSRALKLRRLKWVANHDGYWYVNLYTAEGKQVRVFVHRLVAMAWLPAPDAGRNQVNHIDGDRKNPAASNLQWCTSSENHRHAYRSGLRTVHPKNVERIRAIGRAKRCLSDAQISQSIALHASGSSLAQIAEVMGCHRATIHNVVTKRRPTGI